MVANDASKVVPLKSSGNDLLLKLSARKNLAIPDLTCVEMNRGKENSLMQLDKRFADMKRKRSSLGNSPKSKRMKNNSTVSQSNSSPSPETIDNMKTLSKTIPLNSPRNQRTEKGNQTPSKNNLNTFTSSSADTISSSDIDIKKFIPDTQIISSVESSPFSSIKYNRRNTQIPENLKSTLKIDISFLKKASSSSSGGISEIDSSPIRAPSTPKLRKQVAFSSDVESEPFSSSPLKGCTPKSILKVNEGSLPDKAMSLEHILKQDLTRNESWQVGLVLQIPPNYPGLVNILSTLGKALENPKFNRFYEVYATLNHLIKSNSKTLLSFSYFSRDTLNSIISAVKRDLLQIAQNLHVSDAFKLRTTSQGLKLLASLSILTASMTNNIATIYDLVIKLMMNEHISKGLTISILQFIKVLPENLYEKLESISIALIQMKYFISASISAEKLNILKRFVVLQPPLIGKCGYQLFSFILYSIINTDVPAYGKVLNSATSLLTFSARNCESKNALYKVLSETLNDSYNSLRSNAEIGLKSWMTVTQAICETLHYLIHLELYAQTAKTWSYLVFMASYDRRGFLLKDWESYQYFASVFQKLYTYQGGTAFAIEAWKSVIYNFQISNTNNWDTGKLKDTLDNILSPFKTSSCPRMMI